MSYLKALYSNPKVQKTALALASYYAGAYGGPVAAQYVQAHGPQIAGLLAKLLGG